MAQITQGVTYKQLKRVSDWQMTEEAQRAALAELVHAICRLDTTLHWGEGRTSASDGQRFAMPRKVLQQTYSTRFSDFALEFYSFVADNYAPFYSTPIECTDRDAAFVLDGLLVQRERPGAGGALHRHPRLHGDQLRRVRHAGPAVLPAHPRPQEATHLPSRRRAGLRAARRPGEPGRPHDRPPGRSPSSGTGWGSSTRRSKAATRPPRWPSNGWPPAPPRTASTGPTATWAGSSRPSSSSATCPSRSCGHGSGGACSRSSNCMPWPATSIYGRRGRINARELQEQMNTCSCLTLIMACIIYWQAKEISRVVRWCDPGGRRKSTVRCWSTSAPSSGTTSILYGQYVLDRAQVRR